MQNTELQNIIKKIQREGLNFFKKLPPELQSNKDVALVAVTKSGWCLEYVSEELKNNINIVMAAVSYSGYTLEYASDRLKNDKNVVTRAVSKHPMSLESASESLQNDKELLEIFLNSPSVETQSSFYKQCLTRFKILQEQEWLEQNTPFQPLVKIKPKKF